ncbi:5'-AMP-activated protein kinase beta subunit, interation domain-containing protein [Mycena crocata]|nr:5'-AMP-activated protein kinase beta subunit, interation domain-containing protein [Mycena crocata]
MPARMMRLSVCGFATANPRSTSAPRSTLRYPSAHRSSLSHWRIDPVYCVGAHPHPHGSRFAFSSSFSPLGLVLHIPLGLVLHVALSLLVSLVLFVLLICFLVLLVRSFTSSSSSSLSVDERVANSFLFCSLPTGPFTTTIHLPPGTHHFRFIVDGQTLVAPATEIPNAVDDQGFIANYVAVPGPVGTTTPNTTSATTSASAAVAAAASSKASSTATSATVSPSASTGGRNKRRRPSLPVHPDGSFWARSSAGGSSEDVRLAERVGMSGGSRAKGWTSEIPEALVNAAAQEEAWLDAQAQYQQHAQAQHAAGGGARDASRGRHIVLNGFVPEPSIPPAPRLPRHLERLILNRPSPGVVVPRVATGAGGSGSSMNAVGGSAPSPALRVTTASGTDVSVPMMSFTSASGAGASGSNANGSSHHSHSHSGDRPNAATHPQFGNLPAPAKGVPGSPGSGGGTPLIADDPSVLQTPSHAVLYHLCTSSIRDKMIAVGASTRYRQKYLTTVYYKPAVPSSREESV